MISVPHLFRELQRHRNRGETLPTFMNLFIETGASVGSSSPATGANRTQDPFFLLRHGRSFRGTHFPADSAVLRAILVRYRRRRSREDAASKAYGIDRGWLNAVVLSTHRRDSTRGRLRRTSRIR